MAQGKLNGDHRQWMAVYCRPRTEKKVAERLTDRGVEVYCPLQTTMRQWSDRKKKVQVPVFPSYVFVHVSEAGRLVVLQDPGVMNFVYWLGKPAVIREEEINAIKEFLGEHEAHELEVIQVDIGSLVRIRSGAFADEKAMVSAVRRTSLKNKSKVHLLVECMGIAIRVSTAITNISPLKAD